MKKGPKPAIKANGVRVNGKAKPRIFRHVGGFPDGITDRLEVLGDKVTVVGLEGGRMVQKGLNLVDCLECVKSGQYEEVRE